MAKYFPEVPIKGKLKGNQTLLSVARAERVIGYKPKHSWRNQRAG